MTDATISSEVDQTEPVIERPILSHWVWRPWYAKLWWSSIAVYWTLGLGALLFEPLSDFYSSTLAGFLNIAFYPVFALFILSIGWMMAWKDALDYVAEHPETENTLGWEWQPYDFAGEWTRRLNDTTDPASPSYIAGNNHRLFDH
ncbi:hypothetical protein KRR38_01475 [Novosphingobium sp. G106]|uniref:hypothetical protein n=1 Tax=Novosphingobium sp. G106 TaxID=2849500 RepID=UPI001C2D6862|nr:hypothetical protein [Novosphingobium sp. G106]MBV1686375.1 hypothetical protein [Novosphingobium sp. G106]